MKRSGPPKRRTPLGRGKGFQGAPPPRSGVSATRSTPRVPARRAKGTKGAIRGNCSICGRRGRVVYHHIVMAQKVEAAGGNPDDPRNFLVIDAPYVMGGPPLRNCHDGHHHPGVKDTRIQFERVPTAAREFAVEVLGEGPALAYFRQRYRDVPRDYP